MATTNNIAVIEGYASVFGVPDLNGDRVRRGAFTNILIPARRNRVKMLYQHAADRPIGYWREMRETAHGLFVRGEIILDSAHGQEVATLIEAGALDGLSIGFRTRAARKIKGGRELTLVDLWEISVVTFPMAPGARITRITMPPKPGGKTATLLRDAALQLAS